MARAHSGRRRSAAPAPAEPAPATPALAPADQFVALSAALTGFSPAELWGTGMVPAYQGVIPSIIGQAFLDRLLTRFMNLRRRAGEDAAFLHALIAEELFPDPTLGPLAVNLTYLWYMGQWNQLPAAWRAVHGAFALDSTCIISPKAWEEGLAWVAIGSHPPAAKQPGYGSWALPPVIERPA